MWICLILFIGNGVSAPIIASAEPDESSKVTLTWDELQDLLDINRDDVRLTWEEFQQLLKQTGDDVQINYSVKNGFVILPREQFRQLLERMKPPPQAVPKSPADYIVTKAEYKGKMEANNTDFTAIFYFEIFEKEGGGYQQIPFLPAGAALAEVTLNGSTALVTEKGNWYQLTTSEVGKHRLEARFFAPSDLNKGPKIFELSIIKTAVTLFELSIPLETIELEIANAREIEVIPGNGQTDIKAILPSTNSISVIAHRKYKPIVEDGQDSSDVEEKIPSKIYVETFNLLSIEEDALRINSRIKLNVLQNSIPYVDTQVPTGYSILYVKQKNGQEIRDWQTSETDSGTVLRIPFDTPLKGNAVVHIIAERLFEKEKIECNFPGFEVIKAIRETGYIGAEKKSAAQATPTKIDQLDRIDIKELPFELINMSKRPLLFGFRYLRHPFNLELSIARHDELPTISSVIDMGSVITVVLEDGKLLTKVVYTVRNTWKQFLELQLPYDSEIWTVYVNGKRENASKNEEGTVMIPLARSDMDGDVLNSFTVNLMYYNKGNPFSFIGTRKVDFPLADIMISKMLWSVYLPQDYRYLHFAGDVEKEKMAGTMNLLMGKKRNFDLDMVSTYREAAQSLEKVGGNRHQTQSEDHAYSLSFSSFKNNAINKSDMAAQLNNEADLDQMIQTEQHKGLGQPGSAGEFMKIEMPTSGQLYRFNKTVIESEPITLTVRFSAPWTIIIVEIVIIFIILLALFFSRRIIFLIVGTIYGWVASWESFWNFVGAKSGMRTCLFVGMIIMLYISKLLFFILFILFLTACFRPGWLLPKQKELELDVNQEPVSDVQNVQEEEI